MQARAKEDTEFKLKEESEFKCHASSNQQAHISENYSSYRTDHSKFCYRGDRIGAKQSIIDSVITRIWSELSYRGRCDQTREE